MKIARIILLCDQRESFAGLFDEHSCFEPAFGKTHWENSPTRYYNSDNIDRHRLLSMYVVKTCCISDLHFV